MAAAPPPRSKEEIIGLLKGLVDQHDLTQSEEATLLAAFRFHQDPATFMALQAEDVKYLIAASSLSPGIALLVINLIKSLPGETTVVHVQQQHLRNIYVGLGCSFLGSFFHFFGIFFFLFDLFLGLFDAL